MQKKYFNLDWKWQLKHRITTLNALEKEICLTEKERAAFQKKLDFSFAITPYYIHLLANKAIRKTVLPSIDEGKKGKGELIDPLGEEIHRVTPNLIHTYPDKVLFLITSFCPTYCRYCTRSRMVGCDSVASDYTKSIQYIQQHTEIRDLLISGGDPLTFSNQQLDELLSSLRSISHIRTIRIGSKVPAVLPMRIDKELCSIFRRHRVWLSLHFIHPEELTEQTKVACQMIADHGVGMLSQTVLLRGVNDSVDVLMELFYGLLEINVKPYYLLQCDPVFGSAHFRTSVEKGIECIQSLHGRMAGHAIPQYVIDAPGGGGKIPLLSSKQFQRNGDEIILKNYEGRTYIYPDPLMPLS